MSDITTERTTSVRDYAVTGMTCGGCVRKVQATLAAVDGVTAATVTLSPPVAHLTSSRPVSLGMLSAALAAVGGYRITEASTPMATATSSSVGAGSTMPTTITTADAASGDSLYPLFLIVGYIAGTGAVAAFAFGGAMKLEFFMTYFMAGFFLVFSFFKMLDLSGFVSAYRSYDIVAKAWAPWAYIYPFVELALGLAYLLRIYPTATNLITLVVMSVGAIGVLQALREKRRIRCACLGTALKLPMTTVTLVEDVGMATMALLMLVGVGM